MSDATDGKPEPAPKTSGPKGGDRQERLAARLRDNLRRRKDQARVRREAGDDPPAD